MAGAKVPLTFRIFKGDQLIREERLSLSVIKLGKVPSAHLKLDDETVSRMHAIIEVNGPGDVSIIDLGSTKGTFVNGQKVNKAKLQSGDTIVVGETRIELAIGAADAADDAVTTVGAPASSRPRLTGWSPSTSLAGSMAAIASSSSSPAGSGSWSRMPCTRGSALSRARSASSPARSSPAGCRWSSEAMPTESAAFFLFAT